MIMRILQRVNTGAGRLSSFVRFVFEREDIRKRKEAGFKRDSLTVDPILAKYHFCNVRRADDRVTKFVGEWAKNGKPHDSYDESHEWFWYVVARWFNEPATLTALTSSLYVGWNERNVMSVVNRLAKAGKVFRGSYIINSAYAPRGTSKYEAVVRYALTPIWRGGRDRCLVDTESCERSWRNLMQFNGMGSFMAGQVVADWQTFNIINGRDVDTWAPLGPGSGRGLRWIFQPERKPNQKWAEAHFIVCREAIWDESPDLADSMTLHDVQNCLCEFAKYVRGYSRTRYVPFEDKQGEPAL